jgi:uncharacterized protein with HEPN domain
MKDDRVYLTHILECIQNIEEYVPEGRDQFMYSKIVRDAVIRNLEIIGEATKNISTEFRSQHPEIPWRAMAGMRDVLIHNYMGVDLNIVWNTIDRELPKIKRSLSKFLY